MASSQIIGLGLVGGGFVLLAFLVFYFVAILRKLGPMQAWGLAGAEKFSLPRLTPLAVSFSDEALSADPEPDALPPTADPAPASQPPERNLRSAWLGLMALALLMVILVITGAEFILIGLLQADGDTNILLPLGVVAFAGLLFAFVCRRLMGPSLFEPFQAVLPKRSAPPAALWLTNLSITLIVCSTINLELPNPIHYLMLGLWLFNVALFCWNIVQMTQTPLPDRAAIGQWWQTHKVDILLVSLVGLGALLIRVIGLETYPYAFINDEGEVGWEALNLWHGYKANFFEMGWAGQPMVSFLPTLLSIKIFGLSAVAVRIIGALQGTVAVMGLYLLAREAFGRPVAVISACLLAVLPWHVHFSRLGVMNVGDSLYSALALWLTYRALRKGSYLDYLPAGLITGMSLYTYVGTRLVLAMAVGVLVYAIIRQRHYLTSHFRHLAVFSFAFLMMAAPALYIFTTDPDEFLGRSNQEGLLAGNRLQQLADEEGIPQSEFLGRQLQRSVTIFFASQGPGQFFNTTQPYVPWWAAVFLFVGMMYVFWNITQVRYMMLVGWFWAPILLGSMLTLGPPSHQRMLSAAPALVLLVAIGLWKLMQALQTITRWPKVIFVVLALCFVGITAWHDLHYYFVGSYRTEHRFEVDGNEFSYEVGLRAGSLGPNYRLLLIGDPFIYAPFADFHYLTNLQMDIEDFNVVSPESIGGLPRDKGLFFTAIPSRVDELKLVQQQLPGGTWDEVSFHTKEGILYYAYILPPPSTSAP